MLNALAVGFRAALMSVYVGLLYEVRRGALSGGLGFWIDSFTGLPFRAAIRRRYWTEAPSEEGSAEEGAAEEGSASRTDGPGHFSQASQARPFRPPQSYGTARRMGHERYATSRSYIVRKVGLRNKKKNKATTPSIMGLRGSRIQPWNANLDPSLK